MGIYSRGNCSIMGQSLKYRGYVFDLDGTIYLGDQLLPGASETISRLREKDARVLFLTNKPIDRREAYAEKLSRLGIPTSPDEVINSSMVAAQYLSQQMPGARVYVIGEKSLIDELADVNLTLATDSSNTDLVLISLDRTLTYEKLHFAYHAIKSGARVMATNPDLVCPMPDDEIIDAGAIVAAVEALIRRPLDLIIGKPSRVMIQVLLDRLDLPPETCLMTGDRIETDIKMGHLAGMGTALVLTGVTSRDQIKRSSTQPDLVLDTIHDLLPAVAT